MNLILSDRHFDNLPVHEKTVNFIDLSKLKIANCVGCFGCWTKTPGKCVIRDDAVKVYPLIAESTQIMYITQIKYGEYDSVMKAMLERSIPIQQAFIRLVDGETHHIQRDVAVKKAVVIGYGNVHSKEKEIFFRLVERNAKNMNFESFRVLFADEDQVEKVVRNEVAAWIN